MKPVQIQTVLCAPLLLLGAAPAEQVVPFPGATNEAIIVPVGSPVKFLRFDEYRVAQFSGRFGITGKYSYGCSIECEAPLQDSELVLTIFPDAGLQRVLPHWKERGGDFAIYIRNPSRAASKIATPEERRALRSGAIDEIRGRITIVVDQFQTTIECDGVFNSARLVSLTKVQKVARLEPLGGAGCG